MVPRKPHVSEFATGEIVELFENGGIAACSLVAPCIVETRAGNLVPQYTTDDLRKKTVQAVCFYRSGSLRSLPLEKQGVVTTPIGEMPAEFLTFYESGAVKRVFPLNGKLSGYWGEEEEAALSEKLTVVVGENSLTANCISIGFYEQGSVESITFWPGECVLLNTPVGAVQTRIGAKFSCAGNVLSVEPAVPVTIETPIGNVSAYDNDAVGIIGDNNSLAFHENGEIRSVTTMHTKVVVTDSKGNTTELSPVMRESLCGNGDTEPVPMVIEFVSEGVRVKVEAGGVAHRFSYDQYDISSQPVTSELKVLFEYGGSCSM